jgi:prepilin-type N-terminal cleavage/methylation domain-containing protein
MRIRTNRGFTLIELMIVIALAAILASVAAPSMKHFLEKNRVESHVQSLRTAISFARGEAASRGKTVVICGSNVGATDCLADNNWANGWLVFIDNDSALSAIDTANGDEILRAFEYSGDNVLTVTDDTATALDFLPFNSQGYSLNSQTALLKICPASNDTKYVRAVMISPAGRALISRDVDNDGVHDHTIDDGLGGAATTTSLSCP